MGEAYHLRDFYEFEPLFDAGGSVAALEQSADDRVSYKKDLEKLEDRLAGAKFGASKGEVFDAMRDHSKRLEDAIGSAGDALKVLGKKVERYAGHLDGTQRKLDDLRANALDAHGRHAVAVDAYNGAYRAWQATPSEANACLVDELARELEKVRLEWDGILDGGDRVWEQHRTDVDRIAGDIAAAEGPSFPISFVAPDSIQTCDKDKYGADDSIDAISVVKDALKSKIEQLADVTEYDRIHGKAIEKAVLDFDEQWRPYLELVCGALLEYATNATRFRDNVENADQASAFDFSSMQLDDPEGFQSFVERHVSSVATSAATAAAGLPFDLADISLADEIKNPIPGLSHVNSTPGVMKYLTKGGGLAATGAGAYFDYTSARDEGYSVRTSALAVGGGVIGGLGTAALVGLAGASLLNPVGAAILLTAGVAGGTAGNALVKELFTY